MAARRSGLQLAHRVPRHRIDGDDVLAVEIADDVEQAAIDQQLRAHPFRRLPGFLGQIAHGGEHLVAGFRKGNGRVFSKSIGGTGNKDGFAHEELPFAAWVLFR